MSYIHTNVQYILKVNIWVLILIETEKNYYEQRNQRFFKTYTDFVTKVTSDPSLDIESLVNRISEIDSSSSIKSPRLLTAALGLGSETGEFVEIVKKMYLQGKPPSEDNIFHMKERVRRHYVVLGDCLCSGS